jgi:hypothetical protein
VAERGVPSAEWLCDVEAEDCAAIFQQSMASPVGELMLLFAQAWRQLGKVLLDECDGRYDRFVAKADGSAVMLINCLSRLGYFADVYEHQGMSFPFLKRAQLACHDLALSCPGDARCQFSDLDQLTIFVDNLVPHVLKVDGLLTFDPDLEARIDAGELLAAGSAEEIEIRSMAVYATERLAILAARHGDPVIPLRLSDWLWNRGQLPCYKVHPRPRIRTVHY